MRREVARSAQEAPIMRSIGASRAPVAEMRALGRFMAIVVPRAGKGSRRPSQS
jgi:hypothetical protein